MCSDIFGNCTKDKSLEKGCHFFIGFSACMLIHIHVVLISKFGAKVLLVTQLID